MTPLGRAECPPEIPKESEGDRARQWAQRWAVGASPWRQ